MAYDYQSHVRGHTKQELPDQPLLDRESEKVSRVRPHDWLRRSVAQIIAISLIATGTMETVTAMSDARASHIMGLIGSRIREATSIEDLPWLIASVEREFDEIVKHAEVVIDYPRVDFLVERATRTVYPLPYAIEWSLMEKSYGAGMALLRARRSTHRLVRSTFFDDDTPRSIHDVIYKGYASTICTLVMLDRRPLECWLQQELEMRAHDGLFEMLRLMFAVAQQDAVPMPIVNLEPFDLEGAFRDHQAQRAAFEQGLEVCKQVSRASSGKPCGAK